MVGKKIGFLSRLFLGIILAAAGISLARAHSDRQYISLAPTEGVAHGIVLQADATYQQTFIATRRSLTRLGIFLRLSPDSTSEPVTIQLLRDHQVIGQQTISAAFINSNDATQVRFEPPINTSLGEQLTFKISIPVGLSGKIRAQQRELDSSFSDANVSFFIDDEKQAAPLGYQAFYDYHSPFATQLGSLTLFGAVLVLVWPWRRQYQTWFIGGYLLMVGSLAIIPRLFIAPMPWLLYVVQLVVLMAMYRLMRRAGTGVIPALFAAQVFALTSWWPLHLLANWHNVHVLVAQAATLRDIFLDTYQVASSIKVVGGASWDHYGSYIGIPAALLALVGLIFQARRQWQIFLIGLAGLLAATVWPLIPHAIILTTFGLAYFSGWGLQQLGHYLGPQNRLITIILVAILIISLLDMLYVLAGPLEYGILAQEQIWRS